MSIFYSPQMVCSALLCVAPNHKAVIKGDPTRSVTLLEKQLHGSVEHSLSTLEINRLLDCSPFVGFLSIYMLVICNSTYINFICTSYSHQWNFVLLHISAQYVIISHLPTQANSFIPYLPAHLSSSLYPCPACIS